MRILQQWRWKCSNELRTNVYQPSTFKSSSQFQTCCVFHVRWSISSWLFFFFVTLRHPSHPSIILYLPILIHTTHTQIHRHNNCSMQLPKPLLIAAIFLSPQLNIAPLWRHFGERAKWRLRDGNAFLFKLRKLPTKLFAELQQFERKMGIMRR